MELKTDTYWVPKFAMVNLCRDSEGASKYQSSGQFWTDQFWCLWVWKVPLSTDKININKNNTINEQVLKKYRLLSVQMVSGYHYTLRDPCSLYHTKVKSDISELFSGGCVLVDHDNGYMRIKYPVAINDTETVMDKLTFEREAKS